MSDFPYVEQLGFADGNVYQLRDAEAYHGEPVTLPDYHVLPESYRFYVDGTNGSDDNDGSQSAPFRTLDRFFKLADTLRCDIRCYIVSAGTYDITSNSFTSIAVHITATVAGVVIRFTGHNKDASTYSTAFYNCHCNFQGTAGAPLTFIGIQDSSYWYTDGGAHWFKYCNFNMKTVFYGSGCLLEHCSVNQLESYWSTLKLSQDSFNQNSKSVATVIAKECDISISGANSSIGALSGTPSHALFEFEACTVRYLISSAITGSYKYPYAMKLTNGTTIYSTQSRISNLADNVANGQLYYYGSGDNFNACHITDNYLAVLGSSGSTLGTYNLRDTVEHYNCITLKIKKGDAWYYHDIANGYNSTISSHDVEIDGSTATVSFSGATVTLNALSGLRIDSVLGRNI